MFITLQTKILPNNEQKEKLFDTIKINNEVATWLSNQIKLRNIKTTNPIKIQKIFYQEIRDTFALPSMMTCLLIRRVCGNIKNNKKVCHKYKANSSISYNKDVLSWNYVNDTISILTTNGREKKIQIILGSYQKKYSNAKKKESDLVFKNNKWYLYTTIEIQEEKEIIVNDFLGIDLGLKNIAINNDGEIYCGDKIDKCRKYYNNFRKSLQKRASDLVEKKKRPKNIRRKLKKKSGKEARFRKDVNHQISKKLVVLAKGTGRGIALEKLCGIRSQIRLHKQQRNKFHSWSFGQIQEFIEYKALILGIPIEYVRPEYTSQTCFLCKHTEKENRVSQAEFVCKKCGNKDNADVNASKNISYQGLLSYNLKSRNANDNNC